jgi:hypothetical protein
MTLTGDLRLRQEGAFVNAYWMMPSSREVLLGSIRASLIRRQPCRAAFMSIMRAATADLRSGTERIEDEEEDA